MLKPGNLNRKDAKYAKFKIPMRGKAVSFQPEEEAIRFLLSSLL